MHENQIGSIILGAAIELHKELGPGLLESIYENGLAHYLRKRGLSVETQVPLPVVLNGEHLEYGYRVDLLVEGKVIVEIKSVSELNDVHLAQILTYMKLSEVKLGYLINFNVALLRKGIRRVVRGLSD